jgi:hypothetical protein
MMKMERLEAEFYGLQIERVSKGRSLTMAFLYSILLPPVIATLDAYYCTARISNETLFLDSFSL